MVRGRNFHRPMPDLSITNHWQEWIINDGIADADGTFNNNAPAPSSSVPTPTPGAVRRSARLQGLSPTPGPSDSQIDMTPLTADLIEELKVFQRTTPSWKAWERETAIEV